MIILQCFGGTTIYWISSRKAYSKPLLAIQICLTTQKTDMYSLKLICSPMKIVWNPKAKDRFPLAPFLAETMFCLVGKYDVAYMSDMKNFKITFQQRHHLLHENDMKMMNWHLYSPIFSTFQEMMLPKTGIISRKGEKRHQGEMTNPKPFFVWGGVVPITSCWRNLLLMVRKSG